MQVDSLQQRLVGSLQPSLTELIRLWDYVGYKEEERLDRINQFVQKLQTLLTEFIAQEDAARLDLEQQIESRRREIAEMCQQLGLGSYLPERGLTSSELMNVLNLKSKELIEIKRTKCQDYIKLRKEVLRLTRLLNESSESLTELAQEFPSLLPGSDSTEGHGDGPAEVNGSLTDSVLDQIQTLPSTESLEKLTKLHDTLVPTYKAQAAKHAALREDIGRIAEDIHYQPQSDREVEILRLVGLNHLCQNPMPNSTPGVVRRASQTLSSPSKSPVKSPASKSNGVVNGSKSTAPAAAAVQEPVVTSEVLEWLTEWRLRLVKEKARLVGTCDELRAHLLTMWARLEKPEAEQKIFLAKHSGYKPDDMEALQDEVDRCQQLKWENMQTYVNRLQNEARRLSRLCCLDEKIINLPAGQDPSDSEILVNHLETLLEQLNQTYSLYRPVYEAIAGYEQTWKQLNEVEIKLKDPAIFSNRGGILLKTEKEKKRLLKEVERFEKDALATVEQYELKSSAPFFLSDGRTFLEYVAEKWATYKASRDTSRARRSVVQSSVSEPRPSSGGVRNSTTSAN